MTIRRKSANKFMGISLTKVEAKSRGDPEYKDYKPEPVEYRQVVCSYCLKGGGKDKGPLVKVSIAGRIGYMHRPCFKKFVGDLHDREH